MTFVVKLHVQWNLDGWTERKEEEICPAKEWSSSIQRMPANFTVITQNCFRFDLLVAFNAGPQEYCWFSVPPVTSIYSGYYENQQGSEFQGPGLETTAVNTFWFSLNSASGFPWLSYFNYNFTICCICWGPVTLASQTCQYYHSINVCTLDVTAEYAQIFKSLEVWLIDRVYKWNILLRNREIRLDLYCQEWIPACPAGRCRLSPHSLWCYLFCQTLLLCLDVCCFSAA